MSSHSLQDVNDATQETEERRDESPPDRHGTVGRRGAGTSHFRRRRWAFRLAAATLIPLVLLLVLEGALRLAGAGYPSEFFLRERSAPAQGWGGMEMFLEKHVCADDPRLLALPEELGDDSAIGHPRRRADRSVHGGGQPEGLCAVCLSAPA